MSRRGFNVTTFFDKPAVINSVDRAKIKVYSKFGAFVRTRARSSIRKRKRPSSPGSPPTSRTGLLKRFLFFSYDRANDSVVIGPAKLNMASFDKDHQPTKGTIPEVLENGGEIYILEVRFPSGGWYRKDNRRTRTDSWYYGLPERFREVTIEARPYMGPAFNAELVKAPELWANSIK